MPFIRYVQGDCVSRPLEPAPCDITWSQISSLDGRTNDAFINMHGRKIPAGSLLDVTYRWMFDRDLHLKQFEICQKQINLVKASVVLGGSTPDSKVLKAQSHLEALLSMCLEHPVFVEINIVNSLSGPNTKRRPIRCEIKS